MKLLLIILAVVGALYALRGFRTPTRPSSQAGPASPGRATRTSAPQPSHLPVPMVSCAFCGLHLPREEAFFSPSGEHYCSEAHRIEHNRQGAR